MKLSSNDFSFLVTEVGSGVHVTLTQVSTQKVKNFHLAVGDVVRLTEHMNSLTDDQCRSFMKGVA